MLLEDGEPNLKSEFVAHPEYRRLRVVTMGNTPVPRAREVSRIPNALGFELVRQRGSHMQYRRGDGRCIHRG